VSSDCMIPGSDEFRLDELDELIAQEKSKLQVLLLREKAMRDRIDRFEHERKELCQHPELDPQSSYFSGSYDERASTDYWNVCKRCGATSPIITKTHSYYG
jgi:hypothetical protein